MYIANAVYKVNGTEVELLYENIPYIMGVYSREDRYQVSGLTYRHNKNAKWLIAEPSKQTIVASCFRSLSATGLDVNESSCRSNSPYATPFTSLDQAKSYIRSKQ